MSNQPFNTQACTFEVNCLKKPSHDKLRIYFLYIYFIFISILLFFSITPVKAAEPSAYAPANTADKIGENDDLLLQRNNYRPDNILLHTHPYIPQDSADNINLGNRFLINNDPHYQLPAELVPDSRALARPQDSPLPLSGVPIAPWPGIATAAIPAINAYEPKPGERYTGHVQTLDSITDSEALSAMLSPKTDALRYGDMDDPYFVPTSGWGHVLPQIMPFRQKLQKKGITFTVVYKGEALGNFHGGLRTGLDYVNEMDYNINLDLGRLFGYRNWSVHMVMMDRAGRETGHDRTGEYLVNLQESYGINGHKSFRLADLFAQKNMYHNKLDVAFGRMTLTHIFGTSPLLCTFMTTCSAPAALKADPGLSVYPKGSWGARVIFRPTRDTHFIIGAYQVYPTAQDPGGWVWGSEKTTGISLPIEFTWTPFIGRNRLPGRYKFGYMHDTSNYNDVFGNDGNPIMAAWRNMGYGGRPKHTSKPGSKGDMDAFWFEMEQMMYRLGGRNEMAGGYFMAGEIHNTPHSSIIDNQAYGGISLNGLIKGRSRDRFGFLYSYYHISDRKRLGEMALISDAGADDLATAMVLGDAYGNFGTLGPKVKGAQTSTHIIEAYYSVAAAPGILVQPEFLYQIKPGETHHTPDSAMLGMKVMANL